MIISIFWRLPKRALDGFYFKMLLEIFYLLTTPTFHLSTQPSRPVSIKTTADRGHSAHAKYGPRQSARQSSRSKSEEDGCSGILVRRGLVGQFLVAIRADMCFHFIEVKQYYVWK
jgi:hypothetical protein